MNKFLVGIARFFTFAWMAILLGCGGGGGGSSDTANALFVLANTDYSIAGSVKGLRSDAKLTLTNNGGDPLSVTNDGSFVFGAKVRFNGRYSVAVAEQPVGQTCSLAEGTGSGSGITANVSNIQIVCSVNSYSIGGKVSGLSAGQQVTLTNNDVDSIRISADGTFEFATPVSFSGSYAVRISAQPSGQICSVADDTGSGVAVSENVSSVRIVCSPANFTIGGTVTGLTTGVQLTLQNNLADDLTIVGGGNSNFTFATPVAYGGSYEVTVIAQPTGLSCSVSNGSGTLVNANVSSVQIDCVAVPLYSVTGELVSYSNSNVSPGATGTIQFRLNKAGVPGPWVSVDLDTTKNTLGDGVPFTLSAHDVPPGTSYSIDMLYDQVLLICGNVNGAAGGSVRGDVFAQYYCIPR